MHERKLKRADGNDCTFFSGLHEEVLKFGTFREIRNNCVGVICACQIVDGVFSICDHKKEFFGMGTERQANVAINVAVFAWHSRSSTQATVQVEKVSLQNVVGASLNREMEPRDKSLTR
jgi:hypothetical protein